MAKVPVENDKATYIGMEIEFFTANNAAIRFRTHPICEYAEIGTDASIRPEEIGQIGSELRVLCKYSDLKKVMPILKNYLDDVGAKVNNSCGLHIHLDMRGKDVAKAFGNLIAKQEQMYKSIPRIRKQSEYCRKVSSQAAAGILAALDFQPIKRSDVIKEVNALIKKFKVENDIGIYDADDFVDRIMNVYDTVRENCDTSHYDGISAEPFITGKYKTIEIRLHEATVDVNEIQSWVSYLHDVAFKGVLSESSASYIKRRIAKHG